MKREPQASAYPRDPKIVQISGWIGDMVAAADFPQHVLRFRNETLAPAVGLWTRRTAPLVAALDRYGELYMQAMTRRFTSRLGGEQRGQKRMPR